MKYNGCPIRLSYSIIDITTYFSVRKNSLGFRSYVPNNPSTYVGREECPCLPAKTCPWTVQLDNLAKPVHDRCKNL